MNHTSSCSSSRSALSCFKLCISKHRFCNCTWLCWNPNPGSCIRVSCNLITISNAWPWVECLCCDSAILKCSARDAINYAHYYAFVNVILASQIVLFSRWFRSQWISPRSNAISLNPMNDCVSDFGLLNSLFNAFCISAIPAFGWSWECLIYNVNARSCSALTNVAFLILSSVTPYASHTTLTTNQNWSGSSFPTPLNTSSLLCSPYWTVEVVEVEWVEMEEREVKWVAVWVEVVTAGSAALSNWPHFSEKPSRARPHSPTRMKLTDYFLILHYFRFCRSVGHVVPNINLFT